MSEKRKLGRSILVRLSDDLHSRIDSAARSANQSTAAWLRTVAADRLPAQAPMDRVRSPRRTPPPSLSDSEAALKSLVRESGRVGGAVIQLCKCLREQQRIEHAEAERVLRDVRQMSEEARALLRKIGVP